VDFIDEKDVLISEIGENSRYVSRPLDGGT